MKDTFLAVAIVSSVSTASLAYDSGKTVYFDNNLNFECDSRVRLFNIKENSSRGFGVFNSEDGCASGRLTRIEKQSFAALKQKSDNNSKIKKEIIGNVFGSCDMVMDGNWSAGNSGSGAFLWCISSTGKFDGVYWMGKLKVQFDGSWNGSLR